MKTSSDPSSAPRTIVIIGGVAGGMSTATRLRRLDENLNIVVLEKSGYVSFANCGLPYYVGEVISDRSALLLQTPQSLAERFALDVRVNTEATAIDRENQILTVRSGNGETYQLHYDQLVLSPGARPVVPPIPGAINIPVDELRDRLEEIPSEEVIVHCAVGVRGHTAVRILAAHNIAAKNLDGGYKTWVAGQAITQPATQTESVH